MTIAIVTRSAEVKLMEMLGAIDDPTGWQAVEFHLSELLEQYKSEYQVKIAVNLIHDLLKEHDGGIFLLISHSILLLCRDIEKSVLNKLIFQLRYLYMDDPLAYTEEGDENPNFCTIYDLEKDWQQFWDMSSRRMAMSVRRPAAAKNGQTAKEKAMASSVSPSLEQAKNDLLSASKLANIEDDLRHADLSRVIRRQPVCVSRPGQAVHRVFDELYIHIAHLRQMLKSEVDFFSNRWLFKYLTQILDERVLELIRQNPARYLDHPISLNLNVETLLSNWFAELDATLKPEMKVSIVIEVPVVDVFADLNGFMVAKQEVQKLGYRVCLDGLTVQSFLQIDRDQIGVDLIKLQWNANITDDIASDEGKALAKAVYKAGTNRVILCRCDNKQAVDYGQALGISLFQGRYLDSLINPESKVEN